MIRINKPAEIPKSCEGEAPRRPANFAIRSTPIRRRTRPSSSMAASTVTESVKDALREAQHGKCAFCESKISHIAHGDVEHFRPKAGYRQNPEDPLVQPGYYWLS